MKKLGVIFAIIVIFGMTNTKRLIKLQTNPMVAGISQKMNFQQSNDVTNNISVLNVGEPVEISYPETTPKAVYEQNTEEIVQKEDIKPIEEPKKEKNPLLLGAQGNAGRLVLPSVGYEMPLYTGAESAWTGIVDAYNSALYTNYMGKIMIADHAYQGFYSMVSSPIGSIGYIVQGDKIITIRCVSMYQATNTGNGIMVGNKYADEMNDGSIFMYTCNDETGVNVTVSFWTYA